MTNTSWSGNRTPFPKATRRRILNRDRTCRHCRKHPATIADHIVPVAEGGTDDERNGQGLCAPCHDVKTKAERLRGLARVAPRRPTERHPGLF